MFYEPRKRDHGLPHDPFKALIVPRPIGWITSMSASGAINLAPYSFFNAFTSRPPIVCFGSEGYKDSVAYIAETKEFVCNLATMDLADAMNATSAPHPRGVNEMTVAGLEAEKSRLVKPPRVKLAAAAFECRLVEIKQLNDAAGASIDAFMVFGEVVGVHIEDRFIRDGLVDTAAMKPIARLGYHDYAVVDRVFQIVRPGS